ncbi:MAG: hypothetical protein K1X81_02610 [Bacteroidia bacterium]|nr:hypothetical protein [Bacteroidia bacterium]
MKKLLLLSALAVTVLAFTPSETDYSLCKVNSTANKLVFYYNAPAQAHITAFSYSAVIPFGKYIYIPSLADESVKAANIESGYQNKLYDAVIMVTGSARDVAITFNDKNKDNSLANAEKVEGKYVFIAAEPVHPYTIVGKYQINAKAVKKPGTPANVKALKHQLLIAKVIKKAQSDKLDFDAVIYGDGKNDLAIKFTK